MTAIVLVPATRKANYTDRHFRPQVRQDVRHFYSSINHLRGRATSKAKSSALDEVQRLVKVRLVEARLVTVRQTFGKVARLVEVDRPSEGVDDGVGRALRKRSACQDKARLRLEDGAQVRS